MNPLQAIGMGLVIIVLDPVARGYDMLPDAFGWVLILVGVLKLRTRLASSPSIVTLAAVAAAVSAAVFFPAVEETLDDSTLWLLSLPQLVFTIMLCGALRELAVATDVGDANRFRLLRWGFGLLVVLPVLVYGGGLDVLAVPTGVLSVLLNVYLVYLLFKISKQPYVLT